MRRSDLPIYVLQQIAFRSLKHPDAAVVHKSSCMLAQIVSNSSSLDADHPHGRVVEKLMKESDRIRSTAHTGNKNIRQSAFFLQDLLARLPSDHRLKITDHQRIWMRTQS